MILQDEILKHKVKFLYGFGSSITDKFDKKTSDIDLLVEIDEPDPQYLSDIVNAIELIRQ